MRILLFAGLAEACGARTLDLDLALPVRVEELRARALTACAGLAGRSFRVAVDGRYVQDHESVPPAAEVAFLPPVSGG